MTSRWAPSSLPPSVAAHVLPWACHLRVTALGHLPSRERTVERTGGLFYGDGALLGGNILLVINIIWWVTVTMAPTFLIMKKLNIARVSADIEAAGMDVSKHGVTSTV